VASPALLKCWRRPEAGPEVGVPVAPDEFLPPPEMNNAQRKKMQEVAEKYG